MAFSDSLTEDRVCGGGFLTEPGDTSSLSQAIRKEQQDIQVSMLNLAICVCFRLGMSVEKAGFHPWATQGFPWDLRRPGNTSRFVTWLAHSRGPVKFNKKCEHLLR